MPLSKWNETAKRHNTTFHPYTAAEDEMFTRCGHNNCRFTTDHAAADVVLIDVLGLDWSLAPPPLPRLGGQLWVLHSWEPPYRIWHLPWARFSALFHLTLTYHHRSDIHRPFGKYTPRAGSIPRFIEKKTKLLAWFVSACRTQSNRQTYVTELQKYIPVDIFRACGNQTCTRGNAGCDTMLRDEYKFYLSFENSFCEDYITEKVWLRLGKVVPIVLGGADYKNLLPPNSYIDVRDFRSPQELAGYLYQLDANATLYQEYYEWMRSYHAEYSPPDIQWQCLLCVYINEHVFTQEELDRPGADVAVVTDRDQYCILSSQYYKNIL